MKYSIKLVLTYPLDHRLEWTCPWHHHHHPQNNLDATVLLLLLLNHLRQWRDTMLLNNIHPLRIQSVWQPYIPADTTFE